MKVSSFIEKFFSFPMGNVRTHYYPHPLGQDPILFFHGMSYPLEVWQPLQVYFQQKGFPSLSFDLYGRGKSQFVGTSLTPKDYGDLGTGVLNSWSTEGPVHLISLSNSDWALLEFAHKNPHRAKTLSLVAPSGEDPRIQNWTMKIISHFGPLLKLTESMIRKKVINRMREHLVKGPSEYIDIYRLSQNSILSNKDFVRAFWAHVKGAPIRTEQQRLVNELPTTIPLCLFRFLEEEDSTLGGLKLFELLTHKEEKIFFKGTHMALLENPQEVGKAIEKFLFPFSHHGEKAPRDLPTKRQEKELITPRETGPFLK